MGNQASSFDVSKMNEQTRKAASAPAQTPSPTQALRAYGYDFVGLYLKTLPKGSRVAMLSFVGSLCPITRGHVKAIVEARAILVGLKKPVGPPLQNVFDACVAVVKCNSDGHVRAKTERCGGLFIHGVDRQRLVMLAVRNINAGDYGCPALPWVTVVDRWPQASQLRKRFPSLSFEDYSLNGADDVCKYQKWIGANTSNRFITMGRGAVTDEVKKAIAKHKPDPNFFILGPTLPEISSTLARAALKSGDTTTLNKLLHPDVIQWLQRDSRSPYACFPRKKKNNKKCQARRVHFVGVTGCSRSGKSWLSKLLVQRLNGVRVGQDSFWMQCVSVKLPDGSVSRSEEEPGCTNFDAFVRAIDRAATTAQFVIVEGFCMLHDERVRARFKDCPLFLLELDREECVRRRSCRDGSMPNPNPLSKNTCRKLVWPAHMRYLEASVKPLGNRVTRLQAPANEADMMKLLSKVVSQIDGHFPILSKLNGET